MNQVPPRPRPYSQADLEPPAASGFQPMAFYPVYLGNFWCQQPQELTSCVQAYFASRGLLARMVFSRDASSDPFRTLQTHNKLYDFLVYFCRPEDADDACRFLHRELYYGHRVNILPGREPVFFDPSRTIKYNILNHSETITEQVLENDLTNKAGAQVACVVKHAVRDIYVELVNPANMQQVMTGYWFCAPDQVDPTQPKQRFLEQDVIDEVMKSNQQLMTQAPSQQILDALFQGTNPPVLPPDCDQSKVQKVDMRIRGRKSNKNRKHRQVAQAIAQNFGSRAAFADQLRPGPDTVTQRAIRKVQIKAEKQGLNMAQWWNLFPNAEQIYQQTAAGDPRDWIPYVGTRMPPEDDNVPFTYNDLFNLGLKYIAYVRPKHRY